MVVVFIIGVMATFITLSIGHRTLDARMDVESRRIEELIKLALDEADLKGVPLGLSFDADGYRFLTVDDQHHWADYPGNDALRPRQLAEPFYTQLSVEGHAIAAAPAETRPDAQDKQRVPQILLLPGGDVTAFTLDLRAPGDPSYYHLETDSQGRVKRERREVERR